MVVGNVSIVDMVVVMSVVDIIDGDNVVDNVVDIAEMLLRHWC